MPTEPAKLKKVVLWKTQFSREAYSDQCGHYHEGYIVLEEITAEIIGSHVVPGDYSAETQPYQIGYQARSEDGRIFECNWEYWPETSSTPYWSWYETDQWRTKIIGEWYNAADCAGLKRTPYVENNELKIPPLPYCKKHMVCYNEGAGCYKCDIESLRSNQA